MHTDISQDDAHAARVEEYFKVSMVDVNVSLAGYGLIDETLKVHLKDVVRY